MQTYETGLCKNTFRDVTYKFRDHAEVRIV